MELLLLDGESALGTAIAELRSHVARILEEAASRSAVETAEAAAKRFTFRAQAVEAIEHDSRSAPVLSIVMRDKHLRELDAIEAAVLKRQDELLDYLSRLVSPASPASPALGPAMAPATDDSPTVELPPIMETDPHSPAYQHGHELGQAVDKSWVRSAMIVGWFALVLLFVVVFLLTL